MIRMRALLLSGALLAVGPAAAVDAEAWDVDQNGALSGREWREGLREAGLFAAWDADDSRGLSEHEFASGHFSLFDDDGDGKLTVAEWDEGFDAWYGEREVDLSFEEWNDDEDELLSEEEFVGAVTQAGLFGESTLGVAPPVEPVEAATLPGDPLAEGWAAEEEEEPLEEDLLEDGPGGPLDVEVLEVEGDLEIVGEEAAFAEELSGGKLDEDGVAETPGPLDAGSSEDEPVAAPRPLDVVGDASAAADAEISEEAFLGGLFDWFDEDDDEVLVEAEWGENEYGWFD